MADQNIIPKGGVDPDELNSELSALELAGLQDPAKERERFNRRTQLLSRISSEVDADIQAINSNTRGGFTHNRIDDAYFQEDQSTPENEILWEDPEDARQKDEKERALRDQKLANPQTPQDSIKADTTLWADDVQTAIPETPAQIEEKSFNTDYKPASGSIVDTLLTPILFDINKPSFKPPSQMTEKDLAKTPYDTIESYQQAWNQTGGTRKAMEKAHEVPKHIPTDKDPQLDPQQDSQQDPQQDPQTAPQETPQAAPEDTSLSKQYRDAGVNLFKAGMYQPEIIIANIAIGGAAMLTDFLSSAIDAELSGFRQSITNVVKSGMKGEWGDVAIEALTAGGAVNPLNVIRSTANFIGIGTEDEFMEHGQYVNQLSDGLVDFIEEWKIPVEDSEQSKNDRKNFVEAEGLDNVGTFITQLRNPEYLATDGADVVSSVGAFMAMAYITKGKGGTGAFTKTLEKAAPKILKKLSKSKIGKKAIQSGDLLVHGIGLGYVAAAPQAQDIAESVLLESFNADRDPSQHVTIDELIENFPEHSKSAAFRDKVKWANQIGKKGRATTTLLYGISNVMSLGIMHSNLGMNRAAPALYRASKSLPAVVVGKAAGTTGEILSEGFEESTELGLNRYFTDKYAQGMYGEDVSRTAWASDLWKGFKRGFDDLRDGDFETKNSFMLGALGGGGMSAPMSAYGAASEFGSKRKVNKVIRSEAAGSVMGLTKMVEYSDGTRGPDPVEVQRNLKALKNQGIDLFHLEEAIKTGDPEAINILYNAALGNMVHRAIADIGVSPQNAMDALSSMIQEGLGNEKDDQFQDVNGNPITTEEFIAQKQKILNRAVESYRRVSNTAKHTNLSKGQKSYLFDIVNSQSAVADRIEYHNDNISKLESKEKNNKLEPDEVKELENSRGKLKQLQDSKKTLDSQLKKLFKSEEKQTKVDTATQTAYENNDKLSDAAQEIVTNEELSDKEKDDAIKKLIEKDKELHKITQRQAFEEFKGELVSSKSIEEIRTVGKKYTESFTDSQEQAEQYINTITSLNNIQAEGFSPTDVAGSLKKRWSTSKILMEKELEELAQAHYEAIMPDRLSNPQVRAVVDELLALRKQNLIDDKPPTEGMSEGQRALMNSVPIEILEALDSGKIASIDSYFDLKSITQVDDLYTNKSGTFKKVADKYFNNKKQDKAAALEGPKEDEVTPSTPQPPLDNSTKEPLKKKRVRGQDLTPEEQQEVEENADDEYKDKKRALEGRERVEKAQVQSKLEKIQTKLKRVRRILDDRLGRPIASTFMEQLSTDRKQKEFYDAALVRRKKEVDKFIFDLFGKTLDGDSGFSLTAVYLAEFIKRSDKFRDLSTQGKELLLKLSEQLDRIPTQEFHIFRENDGGAGGTFSAINGNVTLFTEAMAKSMARTDTLFQFQKEFRKNLTKEQFALLQASNPKWADGSEIAADAYHLYSYSDAALVDTFLHIAIHETVHAYTVQRLLLYSAGYLGTATSELEARAQAILSNEEVTHIKEYFNIYDFVVGNAEKIFGTDNVYALSNPLELIAEAQSNPEVRKKLAKVRYGNTTLLQAIEDWFRKLLGFQINRNVNEGDVSVLDALDNFNRYAFETFDIDKRDHVASFLGGSKVNDLVGHIQEYTSNSNTGGFNLIGHITDPHYGPQWEISANSAIDTEMDKLVTKLTPASREQEKYIKQYPDEWKAAKDFNSDPKIYEELSLLKDKIGSTKDLTDNEKGLIKIYPELWERVQRDVAREKNMSSLIAIAKKKRRSKADQRIIDSNKDLWTDIISARAVAGRLSHENFNKLNDDEKLSLVISLIQNGYSTSSDPAISDYEKKNKALIVKTLDGISRTRDLDKAKEQRKVDDDLFLDELREEAIDGVDIYTIATGDKATLGNQDYVFNGSSWVNTKSNNPIKSKSIVRKLDNQVFTERGIPTGDELLTSGIPKKTTKRELRVILDELRSTGGYVTAEMFSILLSGQKISLDALNLIISPNIKEGKKAKRIFGAVGGLSVNELFKQLVESGAIAESQIEDSYEVIGDIIIEIIENGWVDAFEKFVASVVPLQELDPATKRSIQEDIYVKMEAYTSVQQLNPTQGRGPTRFREKHIVYETELLQKAERELLDQEASANQEMRSIHKRFKGLFRKLFNDLLNRIGSQQRVKIDETLSKIQLTPLPKAQRMLQGVQGEIEAQAIKQVLAERNAEDPYAWLDLQPKDMDTPLGRVVEINTYKSLMSIQGNGVLFTISLGPKGWNVMATVDGKLEVLGPDNPYGIDVRNVTNLLGQAGLGQVAIALIDLSQMQDPAKGIKQDELSSELGLESIQNDFKPRVAEAAKKILETQEYGDVNEDGEVTQGRIQDEIEEFKRLPLKERFDNISKLEKQWEDNPQMLAAYLDELQQDLQGEVDGALDQLADGTLTQKDVDLLEKDLAIVRKKLVDLAPVLNAHVDPLNEVNNRYDITALISEEGQDIWSEDDSTPEGTHGMIVHFLDEVGWDSGILPFYVRDMEEYRKGADYVNGGKLSRQATLHYETDPELTQSYLDDKELESVTADDIPIAVVIYVDKDNNSVSPDTEGAERLVIGGVKRYETSVVSDGNSIKSIYKQDTGYQLKALRDLAYAEYSDTEINTASKTGTIPDIYSGHIINTDTFLPLSQIEAVTSQAHAYIGIGVGKIQGTPGTAFIKTQNYRDMIATLDPEIQKEFPGEDQDYHFQSKKSDGPKRPKSTGFAYIWVKGPHGRMIPIRAFTNMIGKVPLWKKSIEDSLKNSTTKELWKENMARIQNKVYWRNKDVSLRGEKGAMFGPDYGFDELNTKEAGEARFSKDLTSTIEQRYFQLKLGGEMEGVIQGQHPKTGELRLQNLTPEQLYNLLGIENAPAQVQWDMLNGGDEGSGAYHQMILDNDILVMNIPASGNIFHSAKFEMEISDFKVSEFSGEITPYEELGKESTEVTKPLKTPEDIGEGFEDDDLEESYSLIHKEINHLDEIHATKQAITSLGYTLAERIGIDIEYVDDPNLEWKGKLKTVDGKETAVINLAYATLDTPVHEVFAHPIIRAIKFEEDGKTLSTLYKNFLDQLHNTPEGQEVFKRVQETYIEKSPKISRTASLYRADVGQVTKGGFELGSIITLDIGTELTPEGLPKDFYFVDDHFSNPSHITYDEKNKKWVNEFGGEFSSEEIATYVSEFRSHMNRAAAVTDAVLYTKEDHEEEALVELLGLKTTVKINEVKDGKFLGILKEFLKNMRDYVKELLKGKGLEINNLSDNITIDELANLLGYRNSKIIRPGFEVKYYGPDLKSFNTYEEAEQHFNKLSETFKEIEKYTDGDVLEFLSQSEEEIMGLDRASRNETLAGFLRNNRDYELSKKAVEKWKSDNNIEYDARDIHKQGRGFYSTIGAYAGMDLDVLLDNLLLHIIDYEQADLDLIISAFTKNRDSKDGVGNSSSNLQFKIYPESKDIKWAATDDVFSGSVGQSGRIFNKGINKMAAGVVHTKYPSPNSLILVLSTLDITKNIDELGIALKGNNFRIEITGEIDINIKNKVNAVNNQLDKRYGKLKEPDLSDHKSDLTPKELEKLEYLEYEYETIGLNRWQLQELDSLLNRYRGVGKYKDHTSLPDLYEEIEKEYDGVDIVDKARANMNITQIKNNGRKFKKGAIMSSIVKKSYYGDPIYTMLVGAIKDAKIIGDPGLIYQAERDLEEYSKEIDLLSPADTDPDFDIGGFTPDDLPFQKLRPGTPRPEVTDRAEVEMSSALDRIPNEDSSLDTNPDHIQTHEKATQRDSERFFKVDYIDRALFSKQNSQETYEWVKKRFEELGIEVDNQLLSVLHHAIKGNGTQVLGVFMDGMVKLSSESTPQTIFHEAFHGIFRLFLSDKQRGEILEDYVKKYGEPTQLASAAATAIDGATGEDIRAIAIEEALADMFAEVQMDLGVVADTIPKKIKKFLKQLYNFLFIDHIDRYSQQQDQIMTISSLYRMIENNTLGRNFLGQRTKKFNEIFKRNMGGINKSHTRFKYKAWSNRFFKDTLSFVNKDVIQEVVLGALREKYPKYSYFEISDFILGDEVPLTANDIIKMAQLAIHNKDKPEKTLAGILFKEIQDLKNLKSRTLAQEAKLANSIQRRSHWVKIWNEMKTSEYRQEIIADMGITFGMDVKVSTQRKKKEDIKEDTKESTDGIQGIDIQDAFDILTKDTTEEIDDFQVPNDEGESSDWGSDIFDDSRSEGDLFTKLSTKNISDSYSTRLKREMAMIPVISQTLWGDMTENEKKSALANVGNHTKTQIGTLYEDAFKVTKILENALIGSLNYYDVLQRLKELAQTYSWAQHLLSRIEQTAVSKGNWETSPILQDMARGMGFKTEAEFIFFKRTEEYTEGPDKKVTIDSIESNRTDPIKILFNRWQSDFENTDFWNNQTQALNKSEGNKALINTYISQIDSIRTEINKVKRNKGNYPPGFDPVQDALSIFVKFGLNIDPDVLRLVGKNRVLLASILTNFRTAIDGIKDRTKSPFDDYKSDILRVLKPFEHISDHTNEDMMRNIKNTTQYTKLYSGELARILHKIQSTKKDKDGNSFAENFIQNLQSFYGFRHMPLLNMLSRSNNRKEFKLQLLDGWKESLGNVGSDLNELSEGIIEAVAINQFFNSKRSYSAQGRAKHVSMKFPAPGDKKMMYFMKVPSLYRPASESDGSAMDNSLFGLFQMELDIILRARENPNLKNLKDKGQKFHFLEFLNDTEWEENKDNRQWIIQTIKEKMDERFEGEYLPWLEKFGVITSAPSFAGFAYNKNILSEAEGIEKGILIPGPDGNVVNPTLDLSNAQVYIDAGVLTVQEGALDYNINNTSPVLDHRIATNEGDLKTGLRSYFYHQFFYNTQFMMLVSGTPAFYKGNSDYSKRSSTWHSSGDYGNPNTNYVKVNVNDFFSDTSEDYINEIENLMRTNNADAGFRKSVITEFRKENDLGDGGTHITLRRRIQIEREFYNLQMTDEIKEMIDRIEAGTATNEDLRFVLQPIKSHVSSPHQPHGKWAVPMQDKHAEFTLFPQVAFMYNGKVRKPTKTDRDNRYKDYKRPKLAAMLDFMIENTVDQISPGSVTKHGQVEKVHDVLDLMGKNATNSFNDYNKDPDNSVFKVDISGEHYKIQQPVPKKGMDSTVTFGSQLRKLIMSSIDMTGGYTIDRIGSIQGSAVRQHWEELLARETTEDLEALDSEMSDPDQVRALLQTETVNRQMGYNAKNSLSKGRSLNFSLPLWIAYRAKSIQNILNAFYRNRVFKQKGYGVSLVNAPSIGYDDDLQVVYNKNGSGAIDYFEIAMPVHNSHIFKNAIKEDGTLDFDKLGPGVLDGVAFRIPSEDKYSLIPVRVKFITDMNEGEIIRMPPQIARITGLDFDIDKMFTLFYMTYYHKKSGKVMRIPSGIDTKAGRNNKKLDIVRGVLMNAKHSMEILNPQSGKVLEGLVNNHIRGVYDEVDEQNLAMPHVQSAQNANLLIGEPLIGIFAASNVFHAYISQVTSFAHKKGIEINGMTNKSLSDVYQRSNNQTKETPSSSADNPRQVFVDGHDAKLGSTLGVGVVTTEDGKDYGISETFQKDDLSRMERDLGIEFDKVPSNNVMEMYGMLVALRNFKDGEFLEIHQDSEVALLFIRAGILERVAGLEGYTHGRYKNWWGGLSPQEQENLHLKAQEIIGIDTALLEKAVYKEESYSKGNYPQDPAIRAIQQKIVDIVMSRPGQITYKFVKAHQDVENNLSKGNSKSDEWANRTQEGNTIKELNTGSSKKSLNTAGHVYNKFLTIVRAIGTYTGLSADYAKNPVLGELNVNMYTAPLVVYMGVNGMRDSEIFSILNQPIIREISQEIVQRMALGEFESDILIDIVERKTQVFKKILEDTEFSIPDSIEEDMIHDVDTNDERLWRNLGDSVEDMNNLDSPTRFTSKEAQWRIKEQYNIMRKWEYMSYEGKDYTRIMRATRIDNGDVGPTLAHVQYAIRELQAVREKFTRPDSHFKGVENIIPLIGYFDGKYKILMNSNLPSMDAYVNVLLKQMNTLNGYIPLFTEGVDQIIGALESAAGNKRFRPDQINTVHSEIQNAVLQSSELTSDPNLFGISTAISAERFIYHFAQNMFLQMKEKLMNPKNASQQEIEDAQRMYGPLFNFLTYKAPNEKLNKEGFSIPYPYIKPETKGLKQGARDAITDAWEDMLYSDDLETKQFGAQLFKYFLYTNGLSNSANSAIEFFPAQFFNDNERLMEKADDLLRANTSVSNAKVISNSILLNKYTDIHFVPRLSKIDIDDTMFNSTIYMDKDGNPADSGVLASISISVTSKFFADLDKGDTWVPFISYKDPKSKKILLYKLAADTSYYNAKGVLQRGDAMYKLYTPPGIPGYIKNYSLGAYELIANKKNYPSIDIDSRVDTEIEMAIDALGEGGSGVVNMKSEVQVYENSIITDSKDVINVITVLFSKDINAFEGIINVKLPVWVEEQVESELSKDEIIAEFQKKICK